MPWHSGLLIVRERRRGAPAARAATSGTPGDAADARDARARLRCRGRPGTGATPATLWYESAEGIGPVPPVLPGPGVATFGHPMDGLSDVSDCSRRQSGQVWRGALAGLLLSGVATADQPPTQLSVFRMEVEPLEPSAHRLGVDRGQTTEGFIPTADGLQLFYRVDGGGPDPVVVLHGGPGFSMAYLRPDLARLISKWTLIFYDQRGAGRSSVTAEASSLTLVKHVEDVDTVRRYFGLDSLVVLGHSWGAGLALQYALRFPSRVSALLLVGPIPPRRSPYWEQFGNNLTARMDASTRQTIAELREARNNAADPVTACRNFWSLFIRGYFADPRRIASFQGDVCGDPPDAVRNQSRVASLTMESLGDWDWREALAEVHARTLAIHGLGDPIPVESAREWVARMPNARLLTIEDSGHFPFVEQPEVFFLAADEFLRGDWPRDAHPVDK